MKLEMNKKYLITTEGWFRAPDGISYNSVFGIVTDVIDGETEKSTIFIGNMFIESSKIHYIIRTDNVSIESSSDSGIYHANQDDIGKFYHSHLRPLQEK